MKASENRPRSDPQVPREIMADDRGGRQPRRGLRQAGPQPAMGPRRIVMDLPYAKHLPQMRLPERNQEVQALPA